MRILKLILVDDTKRTEKALQEQAAPVIPILTKWATCVRNALESRGREKGVGTVESHSEGVGTVESHSEFVGVVGHLHLGIASQDRCCG